MLIVLSPYHLTTREPAAKAALLLASRVVTMMPVPASSATEDDVRRATDEAPAYLRFMESWQWSLPLWRCGVIASTLAGEDAADELPAVFDKIDRESRFGALRPLLRRSLFDDDRSYLGALAADLLKGGPDPGICVPVTAALDRFASRHGLPVARSAPASVAQHAEAKLAKRLFATAIPVLVQGEGEQILKARRLLEPALESLRAALNALVADAAGTPAALDIAELDDAARQYTAAFDAARRELLTPDDPDHVRPVEATATIAAAVLPGDAVLRSSVDAIAVIAGAPRAAARARTAALALADPADARPVIALTIKALGRR